MHIVNIMLSRFGGGIEQAFVDYCEGLSQRGHQVTAVTHPTAAVNSKLAVLGIRIIHLRNFGEWDPLAPLRLRKQLKAIHPDIVITHTGRAFAFARKAISGLCPLVAVSHNYNCRIRRYAQADATFAITHHMIEHLGTVGLEKDRIFHVPNMVRCHELPHRESRHKPPVIGSMGRFVKKKGFDVFIDALTLVKHRGYTFNAVLAGSGTEEKALRAKIREAGLEAQVSMPGWIEDKKDFFNSIDIFCLPSIHEPFGIVLLESFIHGVPVISTDSEGPRDFITPNFDALVVRTGSAIDIADAIIKMLDGEHLADELAANAFAKAKTTYSIEGISGRIEKALLAIITRWRSNAA